MKKLLTVLLGLVLVISLFAGCGGDNEQAATSDESGQGATNETSSEATESQETGESGDKKVQLEIWRWIPMDNENQWPAIEKDFESKYPNIDLVSTKSGNANQYFQKISAALVGGEAPDIIPMQPSSAVQYKEFLLPLESYAKEAWGENYKDVFLPVAMEQCEYSGAGQDLVILPGGLTAVQMLYYNDTLMKKMGFEVPKTLADIQAINETIAADYPDMIPGILIGAKDGWEARDMFMTVVNQVAPGKIYEVLEGQASWTDPEIVKAFEVWQSLFADGVFQEGALGLQTYPDAYKNTYLKEKSLMMAIGTWHMSSMTATTTEMLNGEVGWPMDNHHGMALFPLMVEDGEQNLQVTVDVAWGINKDSKNIDAAWTFVEYMTNGQGAQIFADSYQVLPAVQGMSVDSSGLYGESEKAALATIMDALQNNAVGPREFKNIELQNWLIDELQAVAGGAKSPEDACQSMEQKAQELE